MAKALARYGVSADPEAVQEVILAWTDYASTSEGYFKAKAKALAGVDGPCGLPADYWTRIAENGSALHDRNDMVLQAVGAAKKVGDAFHREASTVWPPLPESVRSQAKLDAYLDDLEAQLSFERTQEAWDAGRLTAVRELKAQLEATSPNPSADPGSLTPRTEAEKHLWLAHLSEVGGETRLQRAARVWEPSSRTWMILPEGQAPDEPWCVAPLKAFGRDHSMASDRPLTSRDRGFVGRLRDENGALTDSACLVTDVRADGRVQVQVIDLTRVGSVPISPARREEFGERHGIQVQDVTMAVPPEDLERAQGSTWDRFAGRRPRFTFENISAVVLESPDEHAGYAFAFFRRANAEAPGMAPKGFLRKLVRG